MTRRPDPLSWVEQRLAAHIMEQGFDIGWAVETARRIALLDATALTVSSRQAAAMLDVSGPSIVKKYKDNGHLPVFVEHRDPEAGWVTDQAFLRASVEYLRLQWDVLDPYGLGPHKWEPPSEEDVWMHLRELGRQPPLPGYGRS